MAFVVNSSLRAAGIDQPGQTETAVLRSTCGAALIRVGADPLDVADYLGYNSLSSVEPFFQDGQPNPAGEP